MAQVKKLQQGGTLNVNGKEYTAEQINDYLSSGQFSSQERAALAGTVRAIQEGKSRYLDANSNSLSGDGDVNTDFADYFGSEFRANRGRSGWNTKKQDRHANRNTDFAIRDKALAKLGNIDSYFSSPEVTGNNATPLGRGSGWFYTDGKYIAGPQNLTNEKHIQNVFKYLSSDDEGKKAWQLTGWDDAMDGLVNWYKGQDVNELLNRIRSNNLTDEDKEVLAFMGYTPSEVDIEASQNATDRERFAKAGYNYDDWSGIIEFDEDGNAVLRVGEDGKTAFSQLGGNGNYFFNDSFFANGQNSNVSFLKDHFVIDGKVYKASDAGIEGSDLYNILRSAGGFYDKNKSGDWEGADQIIKHLWDGRTNYTLGNNSDTYSQFLSDNPNIRWTSITGAYDAPLSDGEQLIEYYDINDPVDNYGYGSAKLAVLDQDGNFLRFIDSKGNATGKTANALTGRKIAQTVSGDTDYDGLIIHDFTDETGNSTGVRIYRNPKNGDMIYSGLIKGASVEDSDYKIPKEIADILNKYGNDFWSNLMQDSRKQNLFARNLGDTVNSGLRDYLNSWVKGFGLNYRSNAMSKKDWMELGITEDDAMALIDWFKHYSHNSTAGNIDQRRVNRLVERTTMRKNGGEIPKFQPGGSVGTDATTAHTQHKLQGTYDNPNNFASLGQEKLDDADYMEIAALLADTAGIGLGLSGAPIASGIAGAVGSLSSFGADVSKDGLDWGDAASLGTNLALDAVSLLPFAGSAAQTGKVVTKIKKIAPTALKLLAAYGISDATKMAFDKVANGDDWTIRDVRTVLNALSGAVSLRKTGIGGSKRPAKTSNEIEVKIKGKSEKIKLTDAEIKKVNEASDKNKALSDLIAARRKVKVSDVDVSSSFVSRKAFKPKTWFSNGQLASAEIETPVSWRESIQNDGSSFSKWASGRGYDQAQYNEFLRSGQWREIVDGTHPQFSKTKPEGWKNVVEVKHPQTGEVIGYRGIAPKESNATTTLRNGFKNSISPRQLTARQREILRKAAIFTPNYMHDRADSEQQFAPGYVPISIPIVVQTDLDSRPRFKKGGVIKAQTGLKFSDWAPDTQQRFKDARAAAMAAGKASFDFEGTTYGLKQGADLPVQSNTELPSYLTNGITSDKDAANAFRQSQGWQTEYVAPTLPDTVSVIEDVVDEPTLTEDLIANGYSDRLIKKQQRWQNRAAKDAARMAAGNPVGEVSGNGSNISDLFRIGKLVNAVNADKFQRKMARNVYDSTMRGMSSDVAEYYNRFQDYGVGEQYKQAANDLRKPIVNVHSDVNSMYADQRARNDQAMKLELEGGLKQSQLYSDWIDQQNELKRNYALKRTENENTNRLRAVNAENAYWTQMGASKAQMQNVVDNALTEQLGLYTQDRAMNYQLADQNESLRYNSDSNNIRAGYQQKLNNAISAGTVNANTTLDEYFTMNPDEYQKYVEQMNALQLDTLNRRMQNYKTYNQQSIFSAKKGGKVSSKQRSASEQIWIENQKITADAVRQLSKQAFEFLKMALS